MRLNHFMRRQLLPTEDAVERRCGAVLTADVVEYSRLTDLDEEQAYFLFLSHRRDVLHPKTRQYRARFLKSTGDGIMAEFATAEDAARCAFDVQVSMAARCKGISNDNRMVFRIGLSWGRIMADDVDIYGHDVNVAARLQTVAPPGGIAMSAEVAERIRQVFPLRLEDMGRMQFHNMTSRVHVFRWQLRNQVVPGLPEPPSVRNANEIKGANRFDAQITVP